MRPTRKTTGKTVLILASSVMEAGIIENALDKRYDIQKEVIDSFITLARAFFGNIHKKYEKVFCIYSFKNRYFFPFFLFFRGEKIRFVYDFNAFLPVPGNPLLKLYHHLNNYLEKLSLVCSAKIIHKGLDDELELLSYYHKIKNKPDYLFREFLNKEFINESESMKDSIVKLSDTDGEIHIVYGGVIYQTDDFYHERNVNLFSRIVSQKMHIHVYAKPCADFAKLKDNPYFHYEGSVPYTQLIKEYAKYDFGLYLYGRTDEKYGSYGTNIWERTGFSNKIFDYIIAGIPILYSDNYKAVCEFLDPLGLGIKGHYTDFDFNSLKDLDLTRYRKMRNMYIRDYNVKRFNEFISQI